MSLWEFFGTRKAKVLIGVKVTAVRGKEEVLIAEYRNMLGFHPEVTSELVLEPIFAEVDVPKLRKIE